MSTWEVAAPVWEWASGGWFFVTLPEDTSDEIAEASEGATGGFGSVRVEVTCGKTTWRTSLFPSKEAGAYVLPMKRSVRQAEGLAEGSAAYLRVHVLGADGERS